MEWVLIIEAIFKLLEQCQEKRSRAEIEAGLKDPGMIERWAIRKIVRKEMGLRGLKLWAAVDEGMEELRSLDAEDIEQLMAGVPAQE